MSDLAGLGADRDRHDGHGDASADDDPREDLRLGAAAEAERGAQAVRVERGGRVAAAQPRPGVALVADVVDDAVGAGHAVSGRHRSASTARSAKSSATRWRRWSSRCSGRSSSATAPRITSYVLVGSSGTSSTRPSRRTARPSAVSRREQLLGALVDLDREHVAGRGHRRDPVGPQQPARVDRDQRVADPLDLAEQVRADHDRDAELGADPVDQRQHRVPAGRVEPVGRLVEQQQVRVVHQRLGQLDPLLHAGRVAADLPVALLVEADVAQRLGGALAGGRPRQPAHPGHVGDELGGGQVGRQAVVLGHVADPGADLPRRRPSGRGRAPGPGRSVGGEQPEQDLDQGGLAGAVRADQPDDAGLHVDGELGQRGHPRVPLGERLVAISVTGSTYGPAAPCS